MSRDVISDEVWAVLGPLFAEGEDHRSAARGPSHGRRRDGVAVPHGCAVAGRAGAIRELEHDLQEPQPVVRHSRDPACWPTGERHSRRTRTGFTADTR